MAAITAKKEQVALSLRVLDWGPEARAALPCRRFSQDDITIGYGGLRINEKRFSVQLCANSALGARTRPSPVGASPVPPRRKRTSVVADVNSVMATCSRGKGVTKSAPPVDDQHQRRIILVFLTIGVGILLISVLLVTVTLRLSPRIDEMVRKENEELLKLQHTAGSANNNGIQETTRPNNNVSSSVPRSSSIPASTHLISEGIEVLAYTKKGNGVKSSPIYCRTLGDIPESPSEIKALPASQESVMISWKPPDHPNGAILSYTIYAKDNSDNVIKNSVRGNTTFYEINGLTKGETYEFWVTAFTVVGEGQRSRVVMQSPGTDKIAAKLASFDSKIIAPADRDVMLQCKAVGIPEPSKKWIRSGNPIATGVRLHVLSDGSLLIKDVHPEDSDNYTCHVENERGDDSVTYSVIIQTVPDPVVFDVSLTTTTTTEVQWKAKNNGGSSILGYKLFYKNEQSAWKTIHLDSATESYHLDGLQCGTTYQLYMIATNQLGDGKPTNVVTTSTKGGVPAVPPKDSLLEEGSTFVTINLQKWQVDSCPIKYFVLEYKKMTAAQWRLFPDDIKPDRSKLVLSDLAPATWYQLRMIAHSNAGPSAGEYTFATLTRDGATIEPAIEPVATPPSPLTYLTDIRFILAGITALLLVLFATVAVLCFCNRKSPKRKHRRRHGSHSSHRKSSRPRSSDQEDYVEGSFTYVGGPVKSSSKEKRKKSKNELTPYATAHLSDFKGKSERNATPQTKSVYPQISRPASSLDSSCPSSSELLSFRNHVQQIPTAPPMSESYCGVPAAFYSHVNKGDHHVHATPSKRFKDNMPPLPPIPHTPGSKLVTERFVRAGDITETPDEMFVFPPPPPPLPEGAAEANNDPPVKVDTNYDAPWDVKGTQP